MQTVASKLAITCLLSFPLLLNHLCHPISVHFRLCPRQLLQPQFRFQARRRIAMMNRQALAAVRVRITALLAGTAPPPTIWGLGLRTHVRIRPCIRRA